LLASRSERAELATATQRSQSLAVSQHGRLRGVAAREAHMTDAARGSAGTAAHGAVIEAITG